MMHIANHQWIWIPTQQAVRGRTQGHVHTLDLLGNSTGRMQRGGRYAASCPAAWRLELVVCQGRQYCAVPLVFLPASVSSYGVPPLYMCMNGHTRSDRAFLPALPRRSDSLSMTPMLTRDFRVFFWNRRIHHNPEAQHYDVTHFRHQRTPTLKCCPAHL